MKIRKILKREFLENSGTISHRPGFAPQFLKNLGIDCIIAESMGPRAINLLNSFGIKAIFGITGKNKRGYRKVYF